jgi:hypothetical protein
MCVTLKELTLIVASALVGMATALIGPRPDIQTLDTATAGFPALHKTHPSLLSCGPVSDRQFIISNPATTQHEPS